MGTKTKQRYISTSFWDDAWVCSLRPLEKMVYLYLLTNPLTNIAGVYKIMDRRICFDTGISGKELIDIMKKFEEAGKAFRMDEYIVIPSSPKHQKLDSAPKLKEGVIQILMDIGPEYLVKLGKYRYRFDLKAVFDRLSIPYPYPKQEKPEASQDAQPADLPTVETILEQADHTGFFIDKEIAKSLLEKTPPDWFGYHSFISFVAIKIREDETYSKNPVDQQRRIFRTVLLDAENYRREYPSWRERKEKMDREEAQAAEHKAKLIELRNCPPTQCQCGAGLGDDFRCPVCNGLYWLNEEDLQWVFLEVSETSLSEGFRRRQAELEKARR
jgi:hypothetical protein